MNIIIIYKYLQQQICQTQNLSNKNDRITIINLNDHILVLFDFLSLYLLSQKIYTKDIEQAPQRSTHALKLLQQRVFFKD